MFTMFTHYSVVRHAARFNTPPISNQKICDTLFYWMNPATFFSEVCTVCDSPTVTSFHFGSRTCKACAAFFRRTVALNVQYNCAEQNECIVHHEKRMICKKCRFDKCLKMDMSPDLVQSKGGEKTDKYTSIASTSSNTSTVSSQDVRSITGTPNTDYTADKIIATYCKMESNLNDRRRIMYTTVKIKDILGTRCECPYERHNLRECDPRGGTSCGARGDFIMLLDYSRGFPHHENLNTAEQNILYRYCCATDKIMNEAFYSVKAGMIEHLYILLNGKFIHMNPPPPSADELIEQGFFKGYEAHIDFYRAIVPFKVSLWFDIVKPMEKINLSFEEFALLKGLVCWHISYYKFSESGRHICEIERNRIMEAILHLNRSDSIGAAERLGELVLFMSCIFEQVYKLVNSMTMITMFELCDFDPMLSDLLDYTNCGCD